MLFIQAFLLHALEARDPAPGRRKRGKRRGKQKAPRAGAPGPWRERGSIGDGQEVCNEVSPAARRERAALHLQAKGDPWRSGIFVTEQQSRPEYIAEPRVLSSEGIAPST